MKRYIEILFDDSGSMTGIHASGKLKHEVAKDLFVKSVLPSIGEPEDQVMLRLLRDIGCRPINSGIKPDFIGPTRKNIEDSIRGINRFDKSTPLYLTLKESIEECARLKSSGAQFEDYMIFVLTDGGDTCNHDIREVISENELKKWKVTIPKLEPVLVQFNVENSISKNNLSGAFKYLGGRSVSVNDASNRSVSLVKKTIKRAGFEGYIIPHCIESDPAGVSYSWQELEKEKILFHQAQLLSHSKLLSFEPDINKKVTHDQYHELKFLHGLAFSTQIPMNIIHAMVAQLERPLLYSHDCIRWDFSTAKWVEIQKAEFYAFEEDKMARFSDDRVNFRRDDFDRSRDRIRSRYYPGVRYIVDSISPDEFTLIKEEMVNLDRPNRVKAVLRYGDVVRFE